MQTGARSRGIVIRFDNVDYEHPDGTIALRGVNLEVATGEAIAILGANGAGKSTLVRHMNGLLKPTHGSVMVFGEETKASSAARLSRRVGIVFQNPNNQLFAQSVRSEIEFGLKNFGFAEELVHQRTEWALESFSLQEYAERPPMELSGGEKKRLCIALVLAWSPDVLILDEPTVGQDSIQKDKLHGIIASLVGEGKTVILVTHDVEFVWPLQPRVILMSEGKVFADGRAQDVLGDGSKTTRAHVLPPELVDLSTLLEVRGAYPRNEYEARDVISLLIKERNAEN